jgi:nucleotide-binding universal stress UspA family protein
VSGYIDQEKQRETLEKDVEYTMDRIRKRLKTFCEMELKGDPDCADRVESIEVCEGFPAEEILKNANALNCDAIIMRTHGKSVIKHAFLGSTTKSVLRRVRKPVFIIPLPEGETDITFHDM